MTFTYLLLVEIYQDFESAISAGWSQAAPGRQLYFSPKDLRPQSRQRLPAPRDGKFIQQHAHCIQLCIRYRLTLSVATREEE